MPQKDYKQGRSDANKSRRYQRNENRKHDGPNNRDYNKGYRQGQSDKIIQQQQRDNSR